MKRFVVVKIDCALWSTLKTAVVGVEGSSPWASVYGEAAFKLACSRLHVAPENCRLVDYQLLPDDTLFVNCGDFL